MCGISGILHFKGFSPNSQTISKMNSAMKHRGPDDEGVFIDEQIGLGHVRLSIIDLSKDGHQPFFSSNNRYVLVFNGEIYNYIEIRKNLEKKFLFHTNTDSEVLLNAYINWGSDCLNHFNGMFAFAIYDIQEKTLFCARDRFGVKPFYYYLDDEIFIFASEPASILAALPNKPNANFQTIFDFLVFGRSDLTDNTFFKEIKKLPHGSLIKINKQKVEISKWYCLSLTQKPFHSEEEYLHTFTEAINIRLRSDVPIGLTLSGGLDSSSIAGILIHKFFKEDINTFSSVYAKTFKEDESKYIELFKDKLPNMHYVFPTHEALYNDLNDLIQTQQEPFNTTSIYANFAIMKEAAKRVKVMLNGQGADEHLAGYHYFFGNFYKDLFLTFKWMSLCKESHAYWKRYHSMYAFKTFAYYMLPGVAKTKLRLSDKMFIDVKFAAKYSSTNDVVNKIDDSDSLNQSLVNHFEYKLEHLLKWDDRNSMRFGIESRNPFLDYRLIEGSMGMNNKFKIKDGLTKRILRDSMKNIIPEQIRLRTDKIGFSTPEDEWFRTPIFTKLIDKTLNSESFKSRGVFDDKATNELYQRHLKRKTNASKEIWKWINVELWFQKYID